MRRALGGLGWSSGALSVDPSLPTRVHPCRWFRGGQWGFREGEAEWAGRVAD